MGGTIPFDDFIMTKNRLESRELAAENRRLKNQVMHLRRELVAANGVLVKLGIEIGTCSQWYVDMINESIKRIEENVDWS